MKTITKQKTSRKKIIKPLRVRPGLLPTSATYGTFEGLEYLMIPVDIFDAWYEDMEDRAVFDYAADDTNSELLRTRKKYLPDSAKKISIDRMKYIAVPVVNVQEWFEDIEDIAVCRYAEENPEPGLFLEDVIQKLGVKLPTVKGVPRQQK